jgi:hypothetical protein
MLAKAASRLEEFKVARRSFDKLLLEALDESLASLGESARQAIYFHLERKFKIKKGEIPYRIEEFTEGLEKIFGFGAQFIEILVMKRLHERIGQPLEWDEEKELVFAEYVIAARRSFQKKKKDTSLN